MPSKTAAIKVRGTCKDCPEGSAPRLVSRPGPRCAEHHRAQRDTRRRVAHGRTVSKYGLRDGEYAILKQAQGGKCWVCQKATGAAKNLAVDHDHDLEEDGKPTRASVRALLCGPCNREVIGRLGPEALQRAIEIYTDPPAQRVLRILDEKPCTQDHWELKA